MHLKDVPRYGDSYVFKAYRINLDAERIEFIYLEDNRIAAEKDIESDLTTILSFYRLEN